MEYRLSLKLVPFVSGIDFGSEMIIFDPKADRKRQNLTPYLLC